MRAHWLAPILPAVICGCGDAGTGGTPPEELLRPPVCAGTFYPADSASLAGAVDSLMAAADPASLPAEIISAVVPHAAYIYSGATAAFLYKAIEGRSFDRVYILAPAHRVGFDGLRIPTRGSYLTPLGAVPIDTAAAERLVLSHPAARSDGGENAEEHAIEVQLPFLQRSLAPGWELVPVLMGWTDENSLALLGELLFAEACQDRILVIASSDLSHYPGAALAETADSMTMAMWARGDPLAFLDATADSRLPEGLDTYACGRFPMAAVLYYNRLYGNVTTDIIAMSNSSYASGDTNEVVGYGCTVACGDMEGALEPLSEQAKRDLCGIVESSLRSAVLGDDFPQVSIEGQLGRYRGVFVTYIEDGRLRGCIGMTRPVYRLGPAAAEMARAAALEDPRFQPVTPSELDGISYEISVLTPLRLLEDPLSVRLGTDGLLMIKNGASGVLLPQVPAEAGWNTAEEFLDGLCAKAGLPAGAWRAGATIYAFEAEVFGPSVEGAGSP